MREIVLILSAVVLITLIATTDGHSQVIFELESTTEGFLPPRLSTVQRDAIPVTAAHDGMIIFNTTSGFLNYYDGVFDIWTSLQPITTINDIDNNRYETITIGTQTWMTENLSVTRYNNGTAIPLVTDNVAWANLLTPAYTWYNNGPSVYGALYNYFVVADTSSLNVCPLGWHVPTDAEWTILSNFLGGVAVAGGHMKETGLAHWNNPNGGATNVSGLTGLPGGNRDIFGPFADIGESCEWWSSTEDAPLAKRRTITKHNGIFNVLSSNKNFGLSVRCLKD